MTNGMKRCPICGEWLALEEFSPDPKRFDHHRQYCKACTAARQREYRRTKLPDAKSTIEYFANTKSPCDNCVSLALCRVEVWRATFKLPCSAENHIKGNKDVKVYVKKEEK